MRRLAAWWNRAAEQSRHEDDERNRLIRLQASRDALFAVLILMAVFAVLSAAEATQTAPPLLTIVVAGIVAFVSWAVRGGSYSVSTNLRFGIMFAGGFLGVGTILYLLDQAGFIDGGAAGNDFVGWALASIVGIAVAVGMQIAVSRRNR